MAEGRRTALRRRLREASDQPPTEGELWSERLDRALDALGGGEGDRLMSDHAHRLLEVRGEVCSSLVMVEGGWVDSPHFGDEDWARAEAQRLYAELGDRLGVGPPPEGFFRPPSAQ